ncbi:MAG: ABC transporter ATP-binding protein [Lachnospiraceae bacterium]|nr:ABC transporter ATP-binding protein [Lachnospiraceae bacterium]
MSVLNVNHISKSYRTGGETVSVLQDISMSVEQEEMVAVMGPSGSGKTTLLHILSGMDTPDEGNVYVNDNEISTFDSEEMAIFRRRNMGMIFQDFKLLESLNVQENILLPLVIDEVDYETQEQKLQYILDVLEIEDLKDKRLNEISGGQKQKAAIGRALIQKPKIIFADEPTGSLDRRSTKVVMECMQKMNRELGAAFMIVTHDVYTASFCDRVVLLRDGRITSEVSYDRSDIDRYNAIINMLRGLGGDEDELV